MKSAVFPLVSILVYTCIAFWVCFPALSSREPAVLGHTYSDVYDHLWGFWWMRKGIIEERRFPLFTSRTHYPPGGHLFFIDPLNAILSIPLQEAFGLPSAYNILVFAHLLLSAGCAYWLAFHLLRDPLAALVTGLIFGFSPYLLSCIYNGVSELLSAGLIPLAILTFLKGMEGKRATGILSGLLLLLTTVASFYYGLITSLALILIGGHRILKNRENRTATFLSCSMPAVIALAGVVPLLIVFIKTVHAPDAIIKDVFFGGASRFHIATDLFLYFLPGKDEGVAIALSESSSFMHLTYLGFFPLLMAYVGVRKEKRTRPHLFLFLFFLLLSFGPKLKVGGTPINWAGNTIPLPFVLFAHLPFFNMINFTYRFVVICFLFLGIMAGAGISSLARSLRPSLRLPFFLAGSSLILFEYLFVSSAPFPLAVAPATIPSVYYKIGKEAGDFGIIDFPPDLHRMNERYAFFQTAHGKRIPYGTNIFLPEALSKNQFILHLLSIANPAFRPAGPSDPRKRAIKSVKELRQLGFRYLVIHERMLSTLARSRIHEFLSPLGQLEKYGEDIFLFSFL